MGCDRDNGQWKSVMKCRMLKMFVKINVLRYRNFCLRPRMCNTKDTALCACAIVCNTKGTLGYIVFFSKGKQ